MKALTTAGLTKLIQLIKSSFISNTDTVTTNTVTLATVATSGSYNDLSNTPTIPTVDQTYDGTSTNAQSGIAIAEELGNYVTGDNTRFDGQWVVSDTEIGNGINLNGSSDLEFTLQVPNDGYKYEALLTIGATSTSTSGQLCQVNVRSSISNNYIAVCRVIPRTAVAVYASGNIILPLSTDRKLYINRSSTIYGTISVYLRAYRRIGSNT